MSENQKYLKKEDLERLDKFIQESLDKYFYVKAWDDLYKNTGKNHKEIISDRSTIPDLVIYNKGFNKLDCFNYPNIKKTKIKFPRTLFILKPKKIKEYNPSSSYIELKSKKEEEQKEKEKEKEEIFEFKSIPKEIENKFIGKEQPESNKLLNELNDFLKNDKDDKPKVELVKEKDKNDNPDKKKNDNNNLIKQKNKFNILNMNALNNYNNYYQKMYQNMQYQNYINMRMNAYNKLNNNKQNLPNNLINKETEKKLISENNNNINPNINKNNNESLKYYTNESSNNGELPDYVQKLEEFMRNNMTERIWILLNVKNGFVRSYNNEELYYLLNIILKNDEIKNYTIDCNKFNQLADVLVAPHEIFAILKKILNKE